MKINNNSIAANTQTTISQKDYGIQTFGNHALTLMEEYGPRFFPCDQYTKKPLVQWVEIPLTHDRIRQMAIDYPDAAIGMVLGNGLAAIDCDLDNDQAAIEAWNSALDEIKGKGTLLCRSRTDSKRWLTVVRVSEPFKKGTLKFDGHKVDNESRAIEFLCDGQFCIVARNGYHYEGDALWDVEPDDLPHLSSDEVVNLVDVMSAAVTVECGWSIESNTINGALRDAPDTSENINTQTGKDLPLIQRRDMVSFALCPDGLGIADSDRESWLTVIQSAVDLLLDDPDMKSFVISCSESKHFPEWEDVTEKEIDYALDRYHNKGNLTGAHIIGLSIHAEDSSKKAAWLKYEKTQQSKRSRKAFEKHRDTIEKAENADSLDKIRVEITLDDSVLVDERERLIGIYQKKFSVVNGENLPKSLAKKHLSLDVVDTDVETVKPAEIPRQVANIALADSEHFKDQRGNFYLQLRSSDGNSSIYALRGEAFSNWCTRKVNSMNPRSLVDSQVIVKILKHIHAKLDKVKNNLPIRKVFIGNGQIGNVRDGNLKLYFDVNDGRVIEIDKDGWRVLDCPPEGICFLPVSDAAAIRIPPQISAQELTTVIDKFWEHLLTPERFRIDHLGQMVFSFFASNNQPLVVASSPGDGNTGKTATLSRSARLIGPTMSVVSAPPHDLVTFQRALIGKRVKFFDDCTRENLPKRYQKVLDSVVTGASIPMKVFYDPTKNSNESVSGTVYMTSNEHELLIKGPTQGRSMHWRFEPIPKHLRKDETEADDAFDKAEDELRGMLFTLISEVICTLPSITDGSGHRFTELAKVVNAVHKVLDVPGSMAETLAAEEKSQLPALMDANPFINDTVDYILTARSDERFVDISPGMLREKLLGSHQNYALTMLRLNRTGSVETNYPASNADAKSALTDDPKTVSLLGLIVETSPPKANSKGEQVAQRDKHGYCMRITLNDNAPKREDVPYNIVEAVERMMREGKSIPDEWKHTYDEVVWDTI